MARQGRALQEVQLRRIVHLLASTDLSILEIAQRTGCSRGAIATVNRRFKVREYAGHRTSWALSPAFKAQASGEF